jgi:hypothetical protein
MTEKKESTPEQPSTPAAPAVSFVGGSRPRTETIALEWPIEVDGARINQIALRRLTGADMVALQDLVAQQNFADHDLFALVCDVSAEVIRALDEDDWIALREKALDFLPRRFREAAASLSRAPGA